jgi:hypothetical protein
MLTFLQATLLATINRSRVARILREIDAPRNQAIAEARLCAKQFMDNPKLLDITRNDLGWTACGTAKQAKRY